MFQSSPSPSECCKYTSLHICSLTCKTWGERALSLLCVHAEKTTSPISITTGLVPSETLAGVVSSQMARVTL